MFEDLIEALEAQGLNPEESITLREICQRTKLSFMTWQERLNSPNVSWMVHEELEKSGYEARGYINGRYRQWVIFKKW